MSPINVALSKRLFRYCWSALLLIFLLSYTFVGLMVWRYGDSTREFGWRYEYRQDGWYVAEVPVNSPAYGKLQPGDRIFAINSGMAVAQPITGYLTYLERFEPIQLKLDNVQTRYSLQIERRGNLEQVDLSVVTVHDRHNYGTILPILLAGFFVAVVGLFIGAIRPEQQVAQLICAALVALALNQGIDSLRPFFNLLQYNERLISFLIFTIYPFNMVLVYHFFYRFPEGLPLSRYWSYWRNLSYLIAIAICATRKWIQWQVLKGEEGIKPLLQHADLLRGYSYLANGFEIAIFISMLAVMVHNYHLAVDADQRRRIRWILYGSLAAALPWGASRLVEIISSLLGYHSTELEGFLELVRYLMIGLVPIAVAYSVIKHRVFDVTVVIRTSLQYMLAKNFLKVIVWLPAIAIIYKIIRNPNQTVAQIFIGSTYSLILFTSAVVTLRFQSSLRNWIDRRFFREAYSQQMILLGLIDEIKQLDATSDIARMVSRKIDTALHPRSIFIFFRNKHDQELTLGYSSAEIDINHLPLSQESALFKLVARDQMARQVTSDSGHWGDKEREWLQLLGVQLIVPMRGTEQECVGLLLLGEKRSEEPYSNQDIKLLQGIAGQLAIAYEMNKLKEHIDKEQKIKQEVLARFEEQHLNLVKECPVCKLCFDSNELRCTKDNAELTLTLPVERVINNKYRLEKLLGKGGMGAVYQATDLVLKRRVAVKILTGGLFGDPGALRRFEREARTSAMLNHANIITVYDFGRLAKEGAYLVMELVDGETLSAVLKREKRLAPSQIANWCEQLFAGLQAAHQAGVIHRDLKPDNIYLARQEHDQIIVKILDFGISKVKYVDNNTLNSVTEPGMIMGTLGYMSPEQLAGEEVDERSDIFSLGVIIFELLTGERPFRGRTLPELLMSMMRGLVKLPDDSPTAQQLNDILQRALARRLEERIENIAQLQREIIPILRAYQQQFPIKVDQSESSISELPTQIAKPHGGSATVSIKKPE